MMSYSPRAQRYFEAEQKRAESIRQLREAEEREFRTRMSDQQKAARRDCDGVLERYNIKRSEKYADQMVDTMYQVCALVRGGK